MEDEAKTTPDSVTNSATDKPRSHIAWTLRRLAASNPQGKAGPGIPARHFVPLCQYHNRSIAAELCGQLQEQGIAIQTQTRRMFVEISVAYENRSEGYKILEGFKASHPDTRPKNFSRDFDLVFVIAFVTIIAACSSFVLRASNWLVPIAIITNGVSLCIVVERWHRSYRYHIGRHFTLKEVFGLTIISAINFAVWRMAV